ncbi:VC1465 family Xer recombination activation factor [Rhodoferax sp.]|uniref:VC1465 family Xer recombination activation factor n=2 Tax=Rhodoferax sp. TaxID=50421 RepID=UPI00273611EE|nr:VC1465 family Xer recombination activation factor [Rhodoferax sp.]MDP3190422.1 VC1465 family Xer recombination activation factor [Rhodoferax sp.]MDP3866371.1 VC1465 family Xer recombination activation factor [Rhodoferax sp.]
MLADLALTPETAGKMLHVNPRTVRYWISGKTLIPYSAYRLLRILTGSELPANGWDGWHMHSGQLWSPEGHGFKPNDSSWWGLLVRQARCFKTLADRETQLRLLAIRAGDGVTATLGGALASSGGVAATTPADAVGRAAKPAGLNLSNKHFRTPNYKNKGFSLENRVHSLAIQSIAKGADHAL